MMMLKGGVAMTIGELAKRTGVTIRTLRHYDHIGLLKPARVTEAGYRLYDEEALRRLHAILLFREVELPLEDIRRILDDPRGDSRRILEMQQTLLRMRREHINSLLEKVQALLEKGMTTMSFAEFDHRQEQDYARQAQAAWGETAAWQEYAQRQEHRSPADNARAGQQLMEMIGAFGRNRPANPDAPEAAAFVRRLQAHITAHFYTCTDEVLLGLADMYETGDFRRNIDKAGGEGTAAFLALAIRHCLGENPN